MVTDNTTHPATHYNLPHGGFFYSLTPSFTRIAHNAARAGGKAKNGLF